MRILVVNVNASQTMTSVIEAGARRYASAGTQIIALQPYFGAEAVDCNFESYLSAVAVMDRVLAYDGPYDAVVLAGFGEHGRDGIAELIEQPVVEICEASAHVAMMIGRAYSVVTTLQRSVPAIEDRLRLAGLWDRCASVRASGMSTLEVDNDPAAAIRAIVAEAAVAVGADHAEVICLGCAGMAGLEEAITSELHAAVVLVGLIVIGIWPGGWPADPVVALGIAAWSAWEGGKSLGEVPAAASKFPTIGVTGTDRCHQNADQAADQRIREIKLNPAPLVPSVMLVVRLSISTATGLAAYHGWAESDPPGVWCQLSSSMRIRSACRPVYQSSVCWSGMVPPCR